MQHDSPVSFDVPTQLRRLVQLGVPALTGYSDDDFVSMGQSLSAATQHGLLVVHPSLIPPSALAPLLARDDKPGFVVVDMTDLDEFEPIEGVSIPDEPLHVIGDLDRGEDMLNWSPEEALLEITHRGRRPLTISEGISWLLQQPKALEPNKCFMTIASRKRKSTGKGLDARTPAIWISNGTGRDG
ncbi:MAG: DUF5701 family protein, partial [Yaniella sp.]|nr:DUF5701 family protein [Yaniella sp.]